MTFARCPLALAAAVASLLVPLALHAGNPGRAPAGAPARSPDARSADLLPPVAVRRLAARAAQPHVLPARSGMAAPAAPPSVAEVGDADTFGRALTWLGVSQMTVDLAGTCPPPGPDGSCTVVVPGPGVTAFSANGLGSIELPARASNSMLCHWFSPVLAVNYANPGATPVKARLAYTPTLTIENPLLDDPSLIDASTGLPFNGRLTTSMTASERFEVPLAPGASQFMRERDSV
ncbi:MAG TPA: hypothetical protein VLK29_12380, partial [Luteimonas sp.]|nr:hypothetical protein [Luteimonas sp.]